MYRFGFVDNIRRGDSHSTSPYQAPGSMVRCVVLRRVLLLWRAYTLIKRVCNKDSYRIKYAFVVKGSKIVEEGTFAAPDSFFSQLD